MGKPKSFHFYDFRIVERVLERQNQVFSFFETPGYLNKLRKSLEHWKYYFCKSQAFNFHFFVIIGKDGHLEMMKIRLNKSWKFAEMGSKSSRKHSMIIW